MGRLIFRGRFYVPGTYGIGPATSMRRGVKQLLYLPVLELRKYDYWWWRYGKAPGGRTGGFRTTV